MIGVGNAAAADGTGESVDGEAAGEKLRPGAIVRLAPCCAGHLVPGRFRLYGWHEARSPLARSRESVRRFLNAKSTREIVFLRGATECGRGD